MVCSYLGVPHFNNSSYMEFELKDKKPSLYNQIKSHFNTITENRICQVIVPFQENLFDCGIYMLEYAEKFLTEPDEFLHDITVNKIFSSQSAHPLPLGE